MISPTFGLSPQRERSIMPCSSERPVHEPRAVLVGEHVEQAGVQHRVEPVAELGQLQGDGAVERARQTIVPLTIRTAPISPMARGGS